MDSWMDSDYDHSGHLAFIQQTIPFGCYNVSVLGGWAANWEVYFFHPCLGVFGSSLLLLSGSLFFMYHFIEMM